MAVATVAVSMAIDTELLLELPDTVFAFNAPLLCQLAVSFHEIAWMRHRQFMAINAGVATVTDLTTHPAIGHPLRVSFPKVRSVRGRSLAVTLFAFRFIPNVAASAQSHVLSRFVDMDIDKVFGVRHFSAVTGKAELLGVTSLTTLCLFL